MTRLVESNDAWNHPPLSAPAPELSIVMPCLNEADTLESCIVTAQRALKDHGIAGEILVADNGSSDGSQDIANRLGVRVIRVNDRGYGSALMGGIAEARGKYILMGDADDSYDYAEVPLPHTIRSKALGAIAKAQTVPQVFVGGRLIGGSEELARFLQEQGRGNPGNAG